ncbi:YjbF family lipoprotein [Photobacterium lipolyticum]|uniref:YjbF family lipoprotein n=1 Tax=Photobacterium lipolyticum TaxID=266810 RepID=A0A2T3MV84_9GAMM|nr:YjbF family lipoprotein [Photobacterium lipolyticum]PSW03849.1 YjbF family lipoprotein [Photobacterium lipolyticum]
MRLHKKTITLLSSLLLAMGLTGCSQKFNDVNDTVQLALFGENDTQISADDVEQLPYASIYAQIDDGPRAFMVLAFAEAPFEITPSLISKEQTSKEKAAQKMAFQGTTAQPVTELKWLSADHGMLVTASGRLVKTHNLPMGNLVASQSQEPDPVALGLHLPSTPRTWQRTLDWQPGYHLGYTLNSQFEQVASEVVMNNEKPVEVLHFVEKVSVNSLDIRYQNDFWVHPTTGKVLQSRQKIAPDLPYVEISLLKPYS